MRNTGGFCLSRVKRVLHLDRQEVRGGVPEGLLGGRTPTCCSAVLSPPRRCCSRGGPRCAAQPRAEDTGHQDGLRPGTSCGSGGSGSCSSRRLLSLLSTSWVWGKGSGERPAKHSTPEMPRKSWRCHWEAPAMQGQVLGGPSQVSPFLSRGPWRQSFPGPWPPGPAGEMEAPQALTASRASSRQPGALAGPTLYADSQRHPVPQLVSTQQLEANSWCSVLTPPLERGPGSRPEGAPPDTRQMRKAGVWNIHVQPGSWGAGRLKLPVQSHREAEKTTRLALLAQGAHHVQIEGDSPQGEQAGEQGTKKSPASDKGHGNHIDSTQRNRGQGE
ncbi:hypothetical protein MC885_017404 [Smutsia gigantea]|nr:hypothetical protein MC885_017404 [Smutsia gigantea]